MITDDLLHQNLFATTIHRGTYARGPRGQSGDRRYDDLIKVAVRDNADSERFLRERLYRIEGVRQTVQPSPCERSSGQLLSIRCCSASGKSRHYAGGLPKCCGIFAQSLRTFWRCEPDRNAKNRQIVCPKRELERYTYLI